jgi:hypothetical protein
MVWAKPPPVTTLDAKPLQPIGQAANPACRLRVGERAVTPRQRHPAGGDPGSPLDPRATPKLAATGGIPAMAKATLHPHPPAKRLPRRTPTG